MTQLLTLDDSNLEQHVRGATLLVFSSAWCGPCRLLVPILETLARSRAGRLRVAKLDVDHAREATVRYGVRGVPTLVLVRDGAEVARTTGAATSGQLGDWVDRTLGT